MESIEFDSGLKEYRINAEGILRFNPADPNLYARFLEAEDKLLEIEAGLGKADADQQPAQLLKQADEQLKALLGWVFGQHNDFDRILGGVSLLAMASNGEPVVSNLFAALTPVLEQGAKAYARQQVDLAVQKAKNRRQSQC